MHFLSHLESLCENRNLKTNFSKKNHIQSPDGVLPIRKLPFLNGSYRNGVCRALWAYSGCKFWIESGKEKRSNQDRVSPILGFFIGFDVDPNVFWSYLQTVASQHLGIDCQLWAQVCLAIINGCPCFYHLRSFLCFSSTIFKDMLYGMCIHGHFW